MVENETPTEKTAVLKPGSLWDRATQTTARALHSGALHMIPTTHEFVEQDGVRFVVWQLSPAIREKTNSWQSVTGAPAAKDADPFLPYDPALFVANLSPTHICLLNKFSVLENHLLIVTRAFADQMSPLTLPDFEALWVCMAEFDGLAFYNAGKIAGASQRHKHLQLVPFPLAPGESGCPIAAALDDIRYQGEVGIAPGLPFVHALARMDPDWRAAPRQAAAATLNRYTSLLHALGLDAAHQPNDSQSRGYQDDSDDNGESGDAPVPYNLLITREWMLLAPRAYESFAEIPVNSLGFAGSLFVHDAAQMQALKQTGPMTILSKVAVPVSGAMV